MIITIREQGDIFAQCKPQEFRGFGRNGSSLELEEATRIIKDALTHEWGM